MKKLILNLFGWLAGQVARKYQVKIVAITGSVGKTTTKEAVFAVLKQGYFAQRSLYNANTEWGIAASVIDPGFEPAFTESGKARITLAQLITLKLKGLWKLITKQKYPAVLVLEMAADRPGDIHWFNRWFDYDVAVITTIGDSHLEFYKSQEQLTAEKLSLTKKLKPQGLAVINGACEKCQKLILVGSQRKVTFGWDEQNYSAKTAGENNYVLHGPEEKIEVKLPIGRQFVPAALIAFAVGEEFGLTSEQIKKGLEEFQPASGRFQIQHTPLWTIIDDTYNASPESMRLAMLSLGDVARGRKVAILGGMRELGSATESGHRRVGEWAAKQTDLLIAIGKEGELIAEGAISAGMLRNNVVNILWDETSPNVDSAISQILPILEEGDTVLVKASRALRLDRLVSRLVAQKKI